MSNVVFKKLELENFRRYTETSITFENGFTAITGKNGAGKSTYFMGLMVALYGTTADGLEITSLVNKKEKKNLLVKLTFSIDADEYEIIRAYKHKKLGNSLILNKNNNNISGKTNSETYTIIENLILPKKVFLNCIYFHQQIKDFFTSLTDSKQKEIFDSILQLHCWGEYYDAMSSKISKYQSLLAEENSSLIKFENKKNQTLQFKEQLLAKIENSINELNRKIEDAKTTIQLKKEELSKLEIEKELVQYSSVAHEKIIIEYNEVFKKLENCREELNEKILNLTTTFKNNLIEDKTKIETQYKDFIKEKSFEKEKLNSDLSKKKTEIDISYYSEETVCNNTISELNNKKHEVEVKSYHVQTKYDISNDKTEYVTSCNSLKSKIEVSKSKLKNINDKKEMIRSEKEILSKQIISLKNNLNKDVIICEECGQEIKDEKHINLVKEKIVTLETKLLGYNIDNLIEEETTLNKIIRESETEVSTIEKTFSDLVKQKNESKQKELNIISTEIAEISTKIKNNNLILSNIQERKNQDKIKIESEYSILKTNIDSEILKEKSKIETDFKSKKEIREQELVANEKLATQEYERKSLDLKNKLEELTTSKLRIEQEKNKFDTIGTKITQKNIEIQYSISEFNKLSTTQIDKSDVTKLDLELTSFDKELLKIKDSINLYSRKLQICEFWKEGFSDRGIPSMLIDSSIPFMNSAINEELNKICPGKFVVSFDTISQLKSGDLKEKFSVNVLNTETGADNHKELSGGEKRLVDICCFRVLRRLSENLFERKFNISLYDEALDAIDEENCQFICRYLRMLGDDTCQIITSHSLDKISESDKILRIT